MRDFFPPIVFCLELFIIHCIHTNAVFDHFSLLFNHSYHHLEHCVSTESFFSQVLSGRCHSDNVYCMDCIILLIWELVTLRGKFCMATNFSASVSHKRQYWISQTEHYPVQLHSSILFSRQRSLIVSIFSAMFGLRFGNFILAPDVEIIFAR